MKPLTKIILNNESGHVSSVVQLTYCSLARNHNTKKALERDINCILTQSKTCNPLYNITSALLSDGEFFAHVIEGPQSSVIKLYSNIIHDTRHGNITLLQHAVVNVRLFSYWPIVYVEVGQISHIDNLNIRSTPADLRKAYVSILKSFRPIFVDGA